MEYFRTGGFYLWPEVPAERTCRMDPLLMKECKKADVSVAEWYMRRAQNP